MNLKNHIKMLQDTIKNLKKDNSTPSHQVFQGGDSSNKNDNNKNIKDLSVRRREGGGDKGENSQVREELHKKEFGADTHYNFPSNEQKRSPDHLYSKFTNKEDDYKPNFDYSTVSAIDNNILGNKKMVESQQSQYGKYSSTSGVSKENFDNNNNKSNIHSKLETYLRSSSKSNEYRKEGNNNDLKFSFNSNQVQESSSKYPPTNTEKYSSPQYTQLDHKGNKGYLQTEYRSGAVKENYNYQPFQNNRDRQKSTDGIEGRDQRDERVEFQVKGNTSIGKSSISSSQYKTPELNKERNYSEKEVSSKQGLNIGESNKYKINDYNHTLDMEAKSHSNSHFSHNNIHSDQLYPPKYSNLTQERENDKFQYSQTLENDLIKKGSNLNFDYGVKKKAYEGKTLQTESNSNNNFNSYLLHTKHEEKNNYNTNDKEFDSNKERYSHKEERDHRKGSALDNNSPEFNRSPYYNQTEKNESHFREDFNKHLRKQMDRSELEYKNNLYESFGKNHRDPYYENNITTTNQAQFVNNNLQEESSEKRNNASEFYYQRNNYYSDHQYPIQENMVKSKLDIQDETSTNQNQSGKNTKYLITDDLPNRASDNKPQSSQTKESIKVKNHDERYQHIEKPPTINNSKIQTKVLSHGRNSNLNSYNNNAKDLNENTPNTNNNTTESLENNRSNQFQSFSNNNEAKKELMNENVDRELIENNSPDSIKIHSKNISSHKHVPYNNDYLEYNKPKCNLVEENQYNAYQNTQNTNNTNTSSKRIHDGMFSFKEKPLKERIQSSKQTSHEINDREEVSSSNKDMNPFNNNQFTDGIEKEYNEEPELDESEKNPYLSGEDSFEEKIKKELGEGNSKTRLLQMKIIKNNSNINVINNNQPQPPSTEVKNNSNHNTKNNRNKDKYGNYINNNSNPKPFKSRKDETTLSHNNTTMSNNNSNTNTIANPKPGKLKSNVLSNTLMSKSKSVGKIKAIRPSQGESKGNNKQIRERDSKLYDNNRQDFEEEKVCLECQSHINMNNELLHKLQQMEAENSDLLAELNQEKEKNERFRFLAEEMITYYEHEYSTKSKDQDSRNFNNTNSIMNYSNVSSHKPQVSSGNKTNSVNNHQGKKTLNKKTENSNNSGMNVGNREKRTPKYQPNSGVNKRVFK